MRIPRLYFKGALERGSAIQLDNDSTHYLSKVLRLRVESQIKLFNNKEGEFLATIISKSTTNVTASVDLQLREPEEDTLRFHVALAITKGERMDYAIQKSVELGVVSIIPFFSELSEVKIKDETRLENKLRHWKSVAMNACQQCGRLALPDIEKPKTFQGLIKQQKNDTYVLLDASGHRNLKEINFKNELYLVFGPEGGFSNSELATAKENTIIASLGPRILRSETAPVVALSILQSEFGDLNG